MKAKCTFFLAGVLLFSLTTVFSQLPVKQWDARFGGTQGDGIRFLEQTTDGGYILGGMSESGIGGDKTQACWGEKDLWILKTDANGVKQWDATFGGDLEEEIYTIEQTSDGGYIVGGDSYSGISGDKTQANKGDLDFWIVKTDANGVKQWDASFGGDQEDELYGAMQTSDGGYILGGYSKSGISGDKTQASQGGSDFWIVKTNSQGIKQWDARYGGDDDDELHYIELTSDGGFILGGKSESGISGDKTQPSQGNADYWIVKTDANGVKQWDARFGASSVDILFGVEQTTDGGYFLGGYTLSDLGGDKSQPTNGFSDYWVIKTDANGVKQWDVVFGADLGDAPYSFRQTTDGGYMLGGRSESGIDGDKTQDTQGGFDYWLVKIDANGTKQYDVRFGGSKNDRLFCMRQTSDQGFILGGESYSSASGDKSQDSQGELDFWIVKISAGAGACLIPSTLISTNITSSSATLSWDAVPGAVGYKISYKKAGGTSPWTFLKVSGNSKTITGLSANTKYLWQVKSVCSFNPLIMSDASAMKVFMTNPLRLESQEDGANIDVYPNPFSSSATISFSLNENSNTRLELFDLAGRNVRTLLDENLDAGNHMLTLDRETLAAGVYLLQVNINNELKVKKLMVE